MHCHSLDFCPSKNKAVPEAAIDQEQNSPPAADFEERAVRRRCRGLLTPPARGRRCRADPPGFLHPAAGQASCGPDRDPRPLHITNALKCQATPCWDARFVPIPGDSTQLPLSPSCAPLDSGSSGSSDSTRLATARGSTWPHWRVEAPGHSVLHELRDRSHFDYIQFFASPTGFRM